MVCSKCPEKLMYSTAGQHSYTVQPYLGRGAGVTHLHYARFLFFAGHDPPPAPHDNGGQTSFELQHAQSCRVVANELVAFRLKHNAVPRPRRRQS